MRPPWVCVLLSAAGVLVVFANMYRALGTSSRLRTVATIRRTRDHAFPLQHPSAAIDHPQLSSAATLSTTVATLDTLAIWLGGSGTALPGCPDDCHPQQHADLWGAVVGPSGHSNMQPDAAGCCASCKAHAAAAHATSGCNVWVFCGNATGCGPSYGHCWLKRQSDPLSTPALSSLGWSWNRLVPWTAGILVGSPPYAVQGRQGGGGHGGSRSSTSSSGGGGSGRAVLASEAHISLDTTLGRVRVRLAITQSPNATRWLLHRASTASSIAASSPTTASATAAAATAAASLSTNPCGTSPPTHSCRFYRAEPVPPGWGRDWFFGPPYALLQGSFGGAKVDPFPLRRAAEGGLVLQRGSLILIDEGPDFLIGLAAHPEWATSYTLLGEVVDEDMADVVDEIMQQRLLVQNWGSINAPVLRTPLDFGLARVSILPPSLSPPAASSQLPPPPPSPLMLLSAGRPARASARGNLAPPDVVTSAQSTDWLRDRWQAAADLSGTPLPGAQWISVALAAGCVASQVLLDWETARADDYELQVRDAAATDGSEGSTELAEGSVWRLLWKAASDVRRRTTSDKHVIDVLNVPHPVHERGGGKTPSAQQPSTPQQLEYRLHIRRPATKWGVSLWRFELWGQCAATSPSSQIPT